MRTPRPATSPATENTNTQRDPGEGRPPRPTGLSPVRAAGRSSRHGGDDTPRIIHDIPTRAIAAHKESRWEFSANGEPLPFEETEQYQAKRIKDRLTFEMVERYCRHLGIELFDPEFYAGDAYIIHSYSPPSTVFTPEYPNAIDKR